MFSGPHIASALAMSGRERGDSPVVMAGDERGRHRHQDLLGVRQAHPHPVRQEGDESPGLNARRGTYGMVCKLKVTTTRVPLESERSDI